MAVSKFLAALEAHGVDPAVIARVREGYEKVSDRSVKRSAFLAHASAVLAETLDFRTRCDVRADCSCSSGGWREKEMRKVAREYQGRSLEEKIAAIGQVRYMGNPVLHEDGTISGGVGTEGGFDCPCPAFRGWKYEQSVSPTYCLCCGEHFRYHYQIALGLKLQVKAVLSTALESQREKPCRFVYEVI